MNGFVLSTWLLEALAADTGRPVSQPSGAMSLAHNVASRDDVARVMDHLAQHGGRILRPADSPPHGGLRGYVADPDEHAWEIAWNPAWPISSEGYVTFAT